LLGLFNLRSEKLQHLALCLQQLHNVWRTKAFRELIASQAPPFDMKENRTFPLATRFRQPTVVNNKALEDIIDKHSLFSKKEKEELETKEKKD